MKGFYLGLHPKAREFENCADDMAKSEFVKSGTDNQIHELENLKRDFVSSLRKDPCFYLPADCEVLNDNAGKMQDVLHLPFETVCVLAPIYPFEHDPHCVEMLIHATEVKEVPPDAVNLVVRGDFLLTVAMKNLHLLDPDTGTEERLPGNWRMVPTLYKTVIGNDSWSHSILWPGRGEDPKKPNEKEQAVHQAVCESATNRIFNLCALLSLHNVKTKEHFPPALLNIRRTKSNLLPLRSFHTLVVDGESWAHERPKNATGSGVRSHLRRGHIRRLDEVRRVWVRSTVVQGSRPGFISKNYFVKPKD